jgi:ubiquinone/menaquinone biosynthesis C-methylase UbiE
MVSLVAAETVRARSQANPKPHLCPWWVGYLLVNPLRRLIESPEQLVGPFVQVGATVLELGPGMGFFTLPLAHAVGPEGRVIAVDIQERMLRRLHSRVERAGLSERIDTRLATAEGLDVADLRGKVHLAVLIYVLHEVADREGTLSQIATTLAPGGRVLLLEPRGHCSAELWRVELDAAEKAGLVPVPAPLPEGRRRHAALLCRA